MDLHPDHVCTSYFVRIERKQRTVRRLHVNATTVQIALAFRDVCARALPPRKRGNWICSFLPWILYVPGVFGRLSGAKAANDSAQSKNAVILRYSFVSTYPQFRGMLISGNKVSSLEDPKAMGKGFSWALGNINCADGFEANYRTEQSGPNKTVKMRGQ